MGERGTANAATPRAVTSAGAATSARAACVALACVVLAGCDATGGLILVLDDEWAADAVFLELAVAVPLEEEEAGCDELLAVATQYPAGEPVAGLDVIHSFGVPLEQLSTLPPLGTLPQGALIAARVRDAECRVLGQSCMQLALEYGDQQLRLALAPPEAPLAPCADGYRCEEGLPGECTYGNCLDDLDCWDADLATTGLCEDWFCAQVADADGDGVAPPEDCDDLDPDVPTTPPLPQCGRAVDADCDRAVDDVDGCGVPQCQRYDLVDVVPPSPGDTLLYGHDVRGVFASGRRVVAALRGPDAHSPVELWLGDLSTDGTLSSVSSMDIEDTDDRVPLDLAVYRDMAFVTHRDGVEVVDLSDDQLPPAAHIGRIGVGGGEEVWSNAVVAPPLLVAALVGRLNVYDATWAAPRDEWPRLVTSFEDFGSLVPAFTAVAARNEWMYVLLSVSQRLRCGQIPAGEAYPEGFAECYSTDRFDGMNPVVSAMTVSASNVVFLTTALTDETTGARSDVLFRLRHPAASPVDMAPDVIGADGVSTFLELGSSADELDATYLGVFGAARDTGDVLVRATGHGPGDARVHLHDAAEPGSWTTCETAGVVYDAAVIGDVLLLAAGEAGLLVGRMVCAP